MTRWCGPAVLTALLCVLLCVGAGSANPLARLRRQVSGNIQSCSQADIIFVIDSSGSIGESNWPKVVQFIKQVVETLDIGPKATHVGAVSFGNQAYLDFHLNKYTNREDVIKHVLDIPWKDEETNTSGGIWMMGNMFSPKFGDRSKAPNIAIVLTDGESTRDHALTIPYAKEAHQKNIVMFAIGIGNNVNETELHGIASNASYVFRVGDFNALPTIQSNIVSAACDIFVPDCPHNADIAFVLDASGSVREENFNKTKNFVKSVIDNLNVDADQSNIAVVTFSNDAQVHIGLNDYNTRTDLIQAINRIPYSRGSTNTAAALRLVRDQVFGSQTRGDRPNMPNVIVVLTDGGSNDLAKTITEARLTRDADIDIITIGISDWTNQVELREMASDPDDLNVFNIESFDVMSRITNDLKGILCDVENECDSNPCANGGTCLNQLNKYTCICLPQYAGPNCNYICKPVDVVVAVDSSGSIGPENYYQILNFTKALVNSMNTWSDHTRVGVETFASSVNVKFNLNSFEERTRIINAISFPYNGGTTDTAGALQMMRETMFTTANGDRPNVHNIGIVITDGRSNDKVKTFQQAVLTRNAGIELLAVAINIKSPYGQQELRGITSDPDAKNLVNVASFADLHLVTESIMKSVCNTVNECASSPCLNGGTCLDATNGYECRCPRDWSGKHCERHCSGKVDVVFVIDSSGSIRQNRYQQMLNYTENVIKALEVSPLKAQVGVITYGDDANLRFNLNTYQRKCDIVQAIETIPFSRGRTNTAAALNTVRTEMFTQANGDRLDAPNYAIVLTDGQSNVNPQNTIPEAIEARIAGIHIMAVTVMPQGPGLEIKAMASDPDTKNMFNVNNFNDMYRMQEELVASMCDTVNECNSNPCQNNGRCIDMLGQYLCVCRDEYTGLTCALRCTRRSDIVFVLDASGSVEHKFVMAMELTKKVVEGLNFAGGRTRVGLATYSDDAQVRFNLNTYTDKQSVLNAIAFTQKLGRTHTASGLNKVIDMFSAINGDRSGDPNYGIIITDGYSNVNADRTIPTAQDAKDADITLLAVGIGENGSVDRTEINAIASDPDNQHAFILPTSAEIDLIASQILKRICQ